MFNTKFLNFVPANNFLSFGFGWWIFFRQTFFLVSGEFKVGAWWILWASILWNFFGDFIDRISSFPLQLDWTFHQIFIFSVSVFLYLFVFVGSYKQTTIRYIWTQNSPSFFLVFVNFKKKLLPYSAVWNLLTNQIFFCFFWREMLRNGTIVCTRVNRSQN